MTPMMTPSYQTGTAMTPAQPMATPQYQPTPRQQQWPNATPSAGARTPSHRPATQPARPAPAGGSTSTAGPGGALPSTTMDWAKAAEMWARKQQKKQKSPAPGESPMMGTPGGDATPLIDER